jgi:hypothetical protein
LTFGTVEFNIRTMREQEVQKTVSIDGLVEFGHYLNSLAQPDYKEYTFEMPDDANRLQPCSLNDVIRRYQEFFNRKTHTFRVWIGYNDYRSNTIGSKETTFTRRT